MELLIAGLSFIGGAVAYHLFLSKVVGTEIDISFDTIDKE